MGLPKNRVDATSTIAEAVGALVGLNWIGSDRRVSACGLERVVRGTLDDPSDQDVYELLPFERLVPWAASPKDCWFSSGCMYLRGTGSCRRMVDDR